MKDGDRRHVCRLIDSAVDRLEQANLRDQLEVPRWIADLVVHLQAAAGDTELTPPLDTITAHGRLLDLRGAYMLPLRAELRYEQDAEEPPEAEPSACPKAGAVR